MKSKSMLIGVTLVALATGVAICAQDRQSAKVPNGLAFAQFKGYETWQVISISHGEPLMAVILGNPAMIDAYKAGVPGNGKPFPDGARMAKIHWVPKKNERAPGQPWSSSACNSPDNAAQATWAVTAPNVAGMWHRFRATVEDWCADGTRREIAATAAVATFELLEAWLCADPA